MINPIGPATLRKLNNVFVIFFTVNIFLANLIIIFDISLKDFFSFLNPFLNPIFNFLNNLPILDFFILFFILSKNFLPIFPSPLPSSFSGVGLFLSLFSFSALSLSADFDGLDFDGLPPASLTRICMFCFATFTSLAILGNNRKFFATILSIAISGVILSDFSFSLETSKTLLLIESVSELGNIFTQRMNMIQ